MFQINSLISTFNEFSLFTSISGLSYNFRDCTKLKEIGLDNITKWERSDMAYSHFNSVIRYIYLPNWVAPSGSRSYFFQYPPTGIRVGKNCTSIARMMLGGSCEYIILEPSRVVARGTSSYSNASCYFVPDDYVNIYKSSSEWSSYSSRIYPISSFREMFPNEPDRMYEPW